MSSKVSNDIRPRKTVLLASPRGFCAGVDRAIQIVEKSIEKYGAPVYVRHEIVHNQHVVKRLEGLGAVFVEELDQCPCLLYTSPSPRDRTRSRMPSSA